MSSKTKVAILGSGNIGTDLMMKIEELSTTLQLTAMVGIDPKSEGLARANALNITPISDGIDGLVKMPEFDDVSIVFDATSAGAHHKHNEILQSYDKQVIDLTPAAIGPYVVPSVNLEEHLGAANLNMVTCGGQATIPIVAAINSVAPVTYGEIVASIASKSAGPGTRANIDEFTETTSKAIEIVGGAAKGKAIIILNPAEPPLIMRDTVHCLCADASHEAIRAAVVKKAAEVQNYVPGFRLKQDVQIEKVGDNNPIRMPEMDYGFTGLKVSVLLEVEGAGHYLPPYAGNLDIMTSAAMKTAEQLVISKKIAA